MDYISVITATYNSENKIKNLISSLNNQTDKNFEWIVIDNKSSDSTISIIKKECNINYKLIIEKDDGIYDALNKGVKFSKNKYYLVIGSDDIIYSNTIYKFNSILKNQKNNFQNIDFIFSAWKVNGKKNFPKKNMGYLYGMLGVGSCHSVATLIKKELHNKFGKYDLNFPVCADQLFVKRAVYGGAKAYYTEFLSGEFSTEGYSSANTLKNLSEFFKIQLITENFKFIQLIFFILRLIKNYKKL